MIIARTRLVAPPSTFGGTALCDRERPKVAICTQKTNVPFNHGPTSTLTTWRIAKNAAAQKEEQRQETLARVQLVRLFVRKTAAIGATAIKARAMIACRTYASALTELQLQEKIVQITTSSIVTLVTLAIAKKAKTA